MRCYLERLRSRKTCCNDRSCNVGYVDDALVSAGAFLFYKSGNMTFCGDDLLSLLQEAVLT